MSTAMCGPPWNFLSACSSPVNPRVPMWIGPAASAFRNAVTEGRVWTCSQARRSYSVTFPTRTERMRPTASTSHHHGDVEPGQEVADRALAAGVVEHLVERVLQGHEPQHLVRRRGRGLERALRIHDAVGHALVHHGRHLQVADVAPAGLRRLGEREVSARADVLVDERVVTI